MRLRQASSAALALESRRPDQADADVAGDVTAPPPACGRAAGWELLRRPGPNDERPEADRWVGWKGFAPEGTLRRRPGVRLPTE